MICCRKTKRTPDTIYNEVWSEPQSNSKAPFKRQKFICFGYTSCWVFKIIDCAQQYSFDASSTTSTNSSWWGESERAIETRNSTATESNDTWQYQWWQFISAFVMAALSNASNHYASTRTWKKRIEKKNQSIVIFFLRKFIN